MMLEMAMLLFDESLRSMSEECLHWAGGDCQKYLLFWGFFNESRSMSEELSFCSYVGKSVTKWFRRHSLSGMLMPLLLLHKMYTVAFPDFSSNG